MFLSDSTTQDPIVLNILKNLPLEDRVFIIEKPHIRGLVETRINRELADNVSQKTISENIKDALKTIRNGEAVH